MTTKMNWIEIPVPIPRPDGGGVARTVTVRVQAAFDPDIGDYVLGDDAQAAIDRAKARHMGLLAPEELNQLRSALGLTQAEMCDMLQLGGKTYTRWESGRERPSRSLNLLLRCLWEGKVSPACLRTMQITSPSAAPVFCTPMRFNVTSLWATSAPSEESADEPVPATA
jgi:DNA-binding transcriptional regulator YiaG